MWWAEAHPTTCDVADLDRVMAFNQTPAAAEAMAHDGVLPESIEFFIMS